MPVVAEKLSSRHGSRKAIASQFWESAEHSTRYIDGQVWELPCEPPALNLTGSSGLSRSQQLIAAQALRLPVVPSYDGNSGGLVLDRVITKVGGRNWWTTISGRIKSQRMYASATRDGLKFKALKDLSSYALCGRTRIQLGSRLTFNGVVEAPDALLLRDTFYPKEGRQSLQGISSRNSIGIADVSSSSSPPDEECCATHGTLRLSLPGHDLSATVGRNMDYVESSGDYARVPLAVSLDLSSLDRPDGLQYRLGLYQVTAPLTEAQGKSSSTNPSTSGIGNRISTSNTGAMGVKRVKQCRTVLHAQGAVAVEGEAYMWKGGSGSGSGAATVVSNSGLSSIETSSSSVSQFAPTPTAMTASAAQNTTDENENNAGRVSEIVATAATADLVDSNAQGAESQDDLAGLICSTSQSEDEASLPTTSVPPQQNEQQQRQGSHLSLENFITPLVKIGDAFHAVTHPHERDSVDNNSASVATDLSVSTSSLPSPAPQRLLPVTSDSVSAVIAESLVALRQLKETVSRVTSDVQDGSLQRLSEQLSMQQAPRRKPYSLLLAQPHVKLTAAMGCLARMPLPHVRALVPGSNQHQINQNPGPAPNTGNHRRSASMGSMTSRASFSSQLADVWEPYLKGTALRVFASTGISGQLGRFTRPVFDYTAMALRLDVGLSSPHIVGSVPGAAGIISSALSESNRPDKHRAFALEGRGSWHALSVSLAQQVVGPFRARADFRFALDPTNVPQDQGERSTLKGLALTALSVRPSLLETVYGGDVVLPGTEGAARLAFWWSPKRREAMAELRLF
ncbi:hypothetical protein NADE_004948 [Nannochloris sp. 'desiccata']|nr:hypothetical protein NADE_004948 [Chlorella desiccata (nom. nud.)]